MKKSGKLSHQEITSPVVLKKEEINQDKIELPALKDNKK